MKFLVDFIGKNALVKSAQTTVAGILAALSVLFGELQFIFDADPLTNPDWNTVVTVLLLSVGLLRARDNDTSSETAGVKKK